MSWLVIQGWLTWSALLCDVNALFNWRSAGPMQRELCFLTSSGWSVPSIQPTLLQPHQSPACQFAQTASKYLLYWLHVLHWLAKRWSLKMHTWCLPNMHHFPPIAVVRSLICLVLTKLATVWSGSFISCSEGFCSSHQMCSHVEIITYLLVVFILSPHRLDHYIFLICSMTVLYYANAYSNGFSPIDQILLA